VTPLYFLKFKITFEVFNNKYSNGRESSLKILE